MILHKLLNLSTDPTANWDAGNVSKSSACRPRVEQEEIVSGKTGLGKSRSITCQASTSAGRTDPSPRRKHVLETPQPLFWVTTGAFSNLSCLGWRSHVVSHHGELPERGSSYKGGDTRTTLEHLHKQGGSPRLLWELRNIPGKGAGKCNQQHFSHK